jgi:hypothetical protein
MQNRRIIPISSLSFSKTLQTPSSPAADKPTEELLSGVKKIIIAKIWRIKEGGQQKFRTTISAYDVSAQTVHRPKGISQQSTTNYFPLMRKK